ncbi:hypothetical protein L9F63_015966, partial [Diploptera punctata]
AITPVSPPDFLCFLHKILYLYKLYLDSYYSTPLDKNESSLDSINRLGNFVSTRRSLIHINMFSVIVLCCLLVNDVHTQRFNTTSAFVTSRVRFPFCFFFLNLTHFRLDSNQIEEIHASTGISCFFFWSSGMADSMLFSQQEQGRTQVADRTHTLELVLLVSYMLDPQQCQDMFQLAEKEYGQCLSYGNAYYNEGLLTAAGHDIISDTGHRKDFFISIFKSITSKSNILFPNIDNIESPSVSATTWYMTLCANTLKGLKKEAFAFSHLGEENSDVKFLKDMTALRKDEMVNQLKTTAQKTLSYSGSIEFSKFYKDICKMICSLREVYTEFVKISLEAILYPTSNVDSESSISQYDVVRYTPCVLESISNVQAKRITQPIVLQILF